MAVLKIKPYGKDQGEFVLIDEENFDPTKHELFEQKQDFAEQMFSDEAHAPVTDETRGKGKPKKQVI